LPDDYEIKDASLVAFAPHPTFPTELASIDSNTDLSRDLFGRRYLPGFVGLNNLNKTDCVNAVVQALAHVRPLRDFFLSQSDHTTVIASTKKVGVATSSSHRLSQQVAHCFGEVVR
jgi:U4/U6.U5 tri-snRNP-associated protein 2